MHDRCSFGTIETGRVPFLLVADGRGEAQVPDWEQPYTYRTLVVPGSNPPIVVTDRISIGPATVTWTIELECQDDYRALLAKRSTKDVLTVPMKLQSHLGTVEEGTHGPYVALPHTVLMDLGRAATELEGPVRVAATFLRVIDPATGEVVP